MEVKEFLEVATYALGAIGAIAGGALFLWRSYKSAVEHQRKHLVSAWTNEGVVFGESDEMLMTIELKDHRGDIIGELNANALGYPLEANVSPGWPWSRVEISRLNRASLTHIARVKVRVVGNNNRLKWRVVQGGLPEIPKKSVLWVCGGA